MISSSQGGFYHGNSTSNLQSASKKMVSGQQSPQPRYNNSGALNSSTQNNSKQMLGNMNQQSTKKVYKFNINQNASGHGMPTGSNSANNSQSRIPTASYNTQQTRNSVQNLPKISLGVGQKMSELNRMSPTPGMASGTGASGQSKIAYNIKPKANSPNTMT